MEFTFAGRVDNSMPSGSSSVPVRVGFRRERSPRDSVLKTRDTTDPPPAVPEEPRPSSSSRPWSCLRIFSSLAARELLFFALFLLLASFLFCSFSSISWTSSIPIPDPTHHHHPKKLCHKTTAHNILGNQRILSSGIETKLMAVLRTASVHAPAPNAAVPPSVRHAEARCRTKPQINREAVNKMLRAALQTPRMASPRSRAAGWVESDVKTMAEEATAKGPVA